MEKKITEKEVIKRLSLGECDEEMIEWATGKYEKLLAAEEKKAEKQKEKALENQPIIEAIESVLTDEYQPASVFANAADVSVQKIVHVLKAMDTVEIGEIKITGKGKSNGYRRREV